MQTEVGSSRAGSLPQRVYFSVGAARFETVLCSYKCNVPQMVYRQCACIRKLLHVSWELLLNELEALLQHDMRLLVLRHAFAPLDLTLQRNVG